MNNIQSCMIRDLVQLSSSGQFLSIYPSEMMKEIKVLPQVLSDNL